MKFDMSNDSKPRENPPTGSVSGVLIQIVDLGHQKKVWQGQEQLKPTLLLVFEIDEKMSDGRRFTVNREFTTSLHEKSNLRLFLEGWRGSKYTEEQLGQFDPKKLLGAACILSLVESKDGKYVNIDAASKLMKGMEPIEPTNPIVFFDMAHYSKEAFDKLWPWVKKKVEQSPEYKKATNGFNDMPDDLPYETAESF
jgi:hypothetical protein